MERWHKRIFKVSILGDSYSGKTTWLKSYMEQKYIKAGTATMNIGVERKELNIQGRDIVIQFWDVPGTSNISNIVQSQYRNCDACILMFDISNSSSFNNIENWLAKIREYDEKIPGFLISNKIDKESERMVSKDAVLELADRLGLNHLETSSKEISTLNSAVECIATNLNKLMPNIPRPPGGITLTQSPRREPRKNSCICG